jgi:hypothetical protein
MKPSYSTLKKNHYSSDYAQPSYVSGEDLYAEIGYGMQALLKEDRRYENTCATRMSLALIKAGVTFAGRRRVKAGPHKGRLFETGAKLLADELMKPGVFGKPALFTDAGKAATSLKGKRGVVFFWKIDGYDGGHIDLIESATTDLLCHSHCYFKCKEVWFWGLS